MAGITTAEANALILASLGVVAYNRTSASKLTLVSVLGTKDAAGTPISGGSYVPELVTFSTTPSSGTASNSLAISFTGMPATNVAGGELYDTASTPNRKWYGPLTGGSLSTNAGDTVTFNVGAFVVGFQVT